MLKLKVGRKVRALVDIHDDASNREIPQHAKVGDIGVVLPHEDADCPTIWWGAGTGFGVYDCLRKEIEVVRAPRVKPKGTCNG